MAPAPAAKATAAPARAARGRAGKSGKVRSPAAGAAKKKAPAKAAGGKGKAGAHLKGSTLEGSAPADQPKRFDPIVKKSEMCAMLDISGRAFQDMVDAGCPVVDRGGQGKAMMVDVSAVMAWVRQRDRKGDDPRRNEVSNSALDARRRNAEAQAELREYELAQLRGEMIRVSEVQPILRDELGSLRARLLQIPGRVAPRIAGLDLAVEEIEAELDQEIADALAELSLDTHELVRGSA